MKLTKHSWRQALVGACAVSLSASMAFTLPAQAETSPADGPNYGDIVAAKQGSITLYKHLYQTASPERSGTVADQADALNGVSEGVKDVVFKAFKFQNVALTGAGANDNWKKLSQLTNETLKGACAGVTVSEGNPTLDSFTFEQGVAFPATNPEGKTTLASLALGAYLICEVKAPEDIVSKADPFMVTIPYPGEVNGAKQWVYDVTAYPKNSRSTLTKTIEQQKAHGFGMGSEVHFPITASVPSIPADNEFDYFIIKDPMDDRFGADSLDVASVKLDNVEMTKGDDYTVNVVKTGENLGGDAGNADHNTVFVSLTQAGLKKLKAAAGKELVVTVKGTITSIGNGTVPNKAYLYQKWSPNGGKTPPPPTTPPTPPGEFPPPPVETPEVKDYWGNARIHKYDGDKTDDPKVGLQGAQFQVFEAKDPYPVNGTCSTEKAEGAQAIRVNGEDTFTSDASGVVNIAGLFVSDDQNNPGKDSTFRCYVLQEIVAPDGYVLPTGDRALTALKITTGETAERTYDAEVANNKPIIPGLPLTGASGQIILTISGIVLLALAGAGFFLYRRNRYAQA